MIPNILLQKGYKLEKTHKTGGQSNTFIISKDEKLCLLKTPKETKISTERKFRFKIEAEALKMMNGYGVPKVLEYSIEDDIFIIMEYINAETLHESISQKPFEKQIAETIFMKLLDTLEKAHNLGLFHRDLKPDNILLLTVNNELIPIIVDFGICWLKKDIDQFKTPTNVELGNRFLRLPELTKGVKLATPISDITFLVGILYYMITGYHPNILLNENMEMPHQRTNVKDIFELEINRQFKYFFDRGFSYNLLTRFQTVEETRKYYKEIHNIPTNMTNLDKAKQQIEDLFNTDQIKKVEELMALLRQVHQTFLEAFRSSLATNLIYAGNGPNANIPDKSVRTSMFLLKRETTHPQVNFSVLSKFDKDYLNITTEFVVNSILVDTLVHSISEKNKLHDNFVTLAKKCSYECMLALEKKFKEMYFS